MFDAWKSIGERRSVRTFDGRELLPEDLEKLCTFIKDIPNPYGLPVEFRLLSSKEQKLSCPVVVGTDLYVGGKMKLSPFLNEAFGYSFERLVLFAQSLGIGTVWIGGTMDRGAFEKAMELEDGEVMPCVTPLGYPAAKMSIRETVMRKGIKAGERLPFESLFFRNDFLTLLTKEAAGKLAGPLEAVRLGPSAVNKQPWRALVRDTSVDFYLKRSKGFGGSAVDMQKIDMGIALCHFAAAAEAEGIAIAFRQDDTTPKAEGHEYIASYTLI